MPPVFGGMKLGRRKPTKNEEEDEAGKSRHGNTKKGGQSFSFSAWFYKIM